MKSINRKFLLFAVLFIGAVVRFYKIGARSLWYDEACSISFTNYSFSDIWSHRYMVKPVYFIILKIWTALFGYSEITARLPAVIFGLLAVFLIYKLAKELFDYKVGLFSALISALSCYHVYYSCQVRNYSLFLLLALLSVLFFLRIVEKNRLSSYVSYGIVNIFLLYTHPYGLFLVIVQNLAALFLWRKTSFKKSWWLVQAVVLVFLIPLISSFFGRPNLNEIDYIPRPDLRILLETFEVFSYGGPRQAHGGLGFIIDCGRLIIPRILSFIFAGFFILGLIPFKKTESNRESVLLLMLWLAVPIAAAYIFSKFFFPVYLTRYLIFVTPPFYVIIARGIARISKPAYQLATVFIILIFSAFCLDVLYHPGPKGNWKDLAGCLRNNIKQQDSIVFVPLRQIVPFWYYYNYQAKKPLSNIDKHGKRIGGRWQSEFFDGSIYVAGVGLNSQEDDIQKQLIHLAKNKGDVWLIVSPDWIGQEKLSLVQEYLGESYFIESKKHFDYNGVDLVRYVSVYR